ncbi:MAG: phytanoyl-CoA dioxygenase family protein [Coxiellaceae bacterium]|nr:phytanoyl-CoA dioxygenase family protein [Coxiellaceae bacterium]
MEVITDLYPSRTDEQERLSERIDPAVYGTADDGPLDQQQLDFYDDNGYLVIPGLMQDCVNDCLVDIPTMKERLQGQDELILEPDSQVLRSVFSPELYSDACKHVSRDPRLLGAAEQILHSQTYIHHSRLNIKSAFDGKSFPWHSDFETWHVEDGVPRMRIVTGWVFLTENNEFNGSLYVIPKSHKKFVACAGATPEDNYKTSLRKQTYGVPSHDAMRTLADEGGMVGVYGPPGTVVFHEGNLMHGSADNISAYARTNLFFVYNSVENIPDKPFGADKPRPEFLARRDYTPL